MEKNRLIKIIISYLLLFIWAAVIFGFSAKDATSSTEQSNIVLKIISMITHIEFDVNSFWAVTETVVRKLAHFSIYTVLGFLAVNAFRFNINKRLILISIVFCFLYAVSDEIHQYFIPERACRLYDIAIDTLGAALGVYVFSYVKRLIVR